MKQLAILASIVLIAGFAVAAEQIDGSQEIAVTDVDESFQHNFSLTEGEYNATNTGVKEYSTSNGTVEFEGVVEKPTPCYELEESISEDNGKYVFEIETVQSEEQEICPQVVAYQGFNAEFSSEEPYELDIRFDEESQRTIEVGQQEEDSDNSTTGEGSSLTNSVLSLLASFF